jgi:hypothetical protein
MKPGLARGAGLLVLLAAGTRPVWSQARPAAGVLVGLRYQSPADPGMDSAASFRTLWLAPRGDGLAVAAEIPQLIVPRRTGFWRLGVLETCRQEESELLGGGYSLDRTQSLWAVSLDHEPAVRVGSEGETVGPCRREPVVCGDERVAVVEFVWPDHVSLDNGIIYGCGLRPEPEVVYAVRRLDDLEERGVAIGEALGPNGSAALLRGYERGKRDHLAGRDDGWDCDVRSPDERNWHVVHREGEWRVFGWADGHRLCGYGFDFPIAIAPPVALVGRAGGPGLTPALKELIPEVRDAFRLPDADLVLAVTDSALLLVRGESPPLLRVPLRPWEAVVMVEWATSDHAARWSRELAALAVRDFPPPRLVRVPARNR